MNRKFGALSSSQDPQKLALTVKGFIPFILVVTAYFQLEVSENDLVQLIEQGLMVVTGLTTIWGIIRKFLPKKEVAE